MSELACVLDAGRLEIAPAHRATLEACAITTAAALWELPGEDVKRAVRGRSTQRATLQHGSETLEVFLKRYEGTPHAVFGSGLRHPSARREWAALCHLAAQDVASIAPMAWAAPDRARRCVLTVGLGPHRRASEFFADPAVPTAKRAALCRGLGQLIGRLHAQRYAHQDLYLVHVFVLPGGKPHLIDLGRAVGPAHFGPRWRTKDLAQLLFSTHGLWSAAERAIFDGAYAVHADFDHRTQPRMQRAIARRVARLLRRHPPTAGTSSLDGTV